MARTTVRRRRRAGRLLAAVLAAVLPAAVPPVHDRPPGTVAGTLAPGAVEGAYIVTLRPGIRAPSAGGRAVAAAYGAEIRHLYRTVLNGYAVAVDERGARALAADPRVASVAQDTRVVTDAARQGREPWGLDRIDQPGLPLDGRFTRPHSAGRGVTVYVIDSGVRITHEEFGGRASHGWDFVDGDRVAGDGNGHGTHVAGTIAGRRHGVASRAEVVAVRVLDDAGSGTTAQVVAGVDWVTRHARRPAVANLSLAGPPDARLDAAVRASVASGVTYVVAAGNGGVSARLRSPARVKQAITVGATGRRDERARFSNWGSTLDLFAPGAGITSASSAHDSGTAVRDGTSMAAPHVAGAAALYLADHTRAAPARVRDALVDRAVSGKVTSRGKGSPDRLLQVNRP